MYVCTYVHTHMSWCAQPHSTPLSKAARPDQTNWYYDNVGKTLPPHHTHSPISPTH